MNFLRTYLHVLGLLGPEARLAIALALANIVLAMATFIEPILLGHIVDALSGNLPANMNAAVTVLAPLVGAWVGFGLFIIAASAMVAWFSDRLAHRRRNLVLADFFEHVLQLSLSYHAGAHSGRQLKIMLSGADTLWWLWVSFFREHFAALVFIIVLLPASLYLNWRLALPLLALCVIFTVVTTVVVRRANALQQAVEKHYSDLAENAADALGNIAVVQSYVRIESEVSALRSLVNSLLRAQMPVLSWWAVAAVLTRSATTLTLLVILLTGAYLKIVGLSSVGAIVSFMAIAALLIARLEQMVGFANRLFLDKPRLDEFFGVLDTVPAVRDAPNAIDPARLRGLVEFKDVSFSYDGKRAAVADLSFTALPGEQIALVGPTGSGKSTALALLHRTFDPQSGLIAHRRHGYPRADADRAPPQRWRGFSGDAFIQPVDRRKLEGWQAGRHGRGAARSRRSRASTGIHRAQSRRFRSAHRRAGPPHLRRRTPAACRGAGAPQGPADLDPRRGHQRARSGDRAARHRSA